MRKRIKARWLLLGLAGLLVASLYAVNASWPAKPTGELTILAHRGPHQRFSRVGLTDETCTAAQSLPPTHTYLENTIRSIAAGFDLGADIIELDIHPTTDGEFAVFHDWTIDCRTEGKGVTREQSMAYLKTLDLGYGYTADGGETFPLRGTGLGEMPTLAEVLKEFRRRQFLVNIKSNDPHEAELLDAYMTRHGIADRYLSFYGGDKVTARLRALRPSSKAGVTASSKDCMLGYLAWGWSGHVPTSCRGALVAVPVNMRRLFWGWPNRFLERMQKAGADVYVGGAADFKRMSLDGLDEPSQITKLPKDWKGGVMTDAIEVVGPALKPERVSGMPPEPLWWNDHRPMMTSVKVDPSGPVILGSRSVVFDKTSLGGMAALTGAPIGNKGDASTSLDWICHHVARPGQDWRVWLTSSEMGGPRIDDVQIETTSKAAPDAECPSLPAELLPITLPHGLRIGMTQAELVEALGEPNNRRGQRWGYTYHRPVSNDGLYASSLWLRLRDGRVDALILGQMTSY